MRRTSMSRSAATGPAPSQIERAIGKAVGFLARRQLVHGEFRTDAAANAALTKQLRAESSPFGTALIVYSLGFCKDERAARMIERGLDFLEAEMEGGGVWRYWASRDPKHEVLPPDLDDTCCCAFALKQHGRRVPNPRALIEANRNAQGLYYTWLARRNSTAPQIVKGYKKFRSSGEVFMGLSGTLDNVDCAVNANVVLYLGERETTRAAIEFMMDMVREDRAAANATNYAHPLTVYYMVARAYANGVKAFGAVRDCLVERVEQARTRRGTFGSPLWNALAACALLDLGADAPGLQSAIESLLRTQRANGSWRGRALYVGPAPYYGSAELTTAFCIEALAKTRKLCRTH